MRRSQKGFTLIELSIVLVIIGLIIGGVLTGQGLINAAAVRAQVTQIEKYNTAVNTFRGKYGGIPGDLTIPLANQFGFLVPSSCTGLQGQRDGNGFIDGGSGTTNVNGITLAGLMGENALFWMDLNTAGLVDISPPTTGSSWNGGSISTGLCVYSTTATNPGTYVPSGKIGNATFVHVFEVGGYNWYQLSAIKGFSAGTSAVSSTPSIPVMQAYNVDKKMDDGVPTTGSVQALYIGSQCCTVTAPNSFSDSAATCYNTAGPSYSISYNNGNASNCALSFRFQ